ncbi:uncharacterized protein LOC131160258 [Malania oleifera]|uniref:uncharacterized protein LOC131160258 n=1 Tax=Malania oleifera TaxID=397392 RepID=UPI0025AEC530|nr:uncharacterized protein LOC131160258 [Malania oleifera]
MLLPPRSGIVLTVYLPLIAVLAIGQSQAREIRPSEHGLTYQNEPSTGHESPEMASFFGGNFSASPSSSVPLPVAKNMSDPAWWGGAAGNRAGEGRDHARNVLVVAGLVCGITGVVLLFVATLLFIFQLRKQKSSAAK